MNKTRSLSCILTVLAISALPLSGQTAAGSISGLVADTSDAVVAGAQVTVTDLDRNVSFRSASNEVGFFLVAPLPPGRYSIQVEMQGFRRFVLEPFPISTQQKASIHVTLELGVVSEAVTVSGALQLIDSSSSTLSGVVENRRIIDLPLNGRNVYSLAALTPGVFGMRPGAGNGGVGEGFVSIGLFSVNGGRDSSNVIMMDGVPVTLNANYAPLNANSAVPSVEGVQEFRIQTNAYTAEYGRSGGGILTIATKSGTNELHGTIFEFLRNSRMDANNWFSNASGGRLATFQRNEFGVSAGGPVVIPKVYNGKDRTFFFNVYEGRRQRAAVSRFMTLPTAEQMAGDFSRTLNAAGQLRVIYDPFTTVADPARPGEFLRSPFSGNQIPLSRVDPVAANVQEFYGPGPNLPGQPFTGQNNFFFQGKAQGNVDRATTKIDHNLSDNQRMFFRYTIFNNQTSQPEFWEGPGCPDGGCFSGAERLQNAVLDYSNTLNPTTLLSLRYGFARSILNRGSWHLGFRPSALGLPVSTEQGADLLAFPEFGVEEVTMPGLFHHWNFRSANQTHTLIGNLAKVFSRHSLKVGSEIRSNFVNNMQAPWSLNFSFNRGMTAGPDPRVVSTTAGFGYASFLLGTGANGVEVLGLRPAVANKSFGFYVQDDWKVSRRLTVNLGLRWDFETGTTERYDRYAVFDPEVRSPLSEQTGLNLSGGWLFPGRGLDGRSLRSVEWGKIAPRAGFAYELRPGLVVRAGAGIFFGMAPYGANDYGTPPFRAVTPWVASVDGVNPNDLLSNPFPNGVLQPEGPANGLLAALGQGLRSPVPSTMTMPYNTQWNFAVSRDFGNSTVLELGYAGNKGTHLPINWQMDQLDPRLIRADAGLLDLVPNPFSGIIPVGPLATPTVQRGQLLTPFPHVPGVNFANASWGNSNFHSFQARFEKHFSAGSTVAVAYTWSKVITDGGDSQWVAEVTRDFYCRSCERSISVINQPQRLVASYTYELPFGRGKQFGGGWTGALNALLGQWQVNGILTLNSGLPLIVGTTGNTSFSFGGGQHPDSTGQDAKLDHPTLDKWFDTEAFRLPAQYTFGNMARVHPTLRSDFVENLDFSIFKRFSLREPFSLEFRGEWFNALNHPVFGAPNTTVGNAQFGRVTAIANIPRQTQLALKLLF